MAFAMLDETLLLLKIVEAIDYHIRYSSGSIVRLDYKRISRYLSRTVDIRSSYAYILRQIINGELGLAECEIISDDKKERGKRLYRRECVMRKLDEIRNKLISSGR